MRAREMTIGEVASRAGLTTQGIRYYEHQGLLPKAHRTHTGYRLHGPEVLNRLGFIKQARHLGLSLDEIRRILRMSQAGRAPCCEVRELLAGKLEQLDRTIAELSRFRQELRQFLAGIARMPDQADTSQRVCALIETAATLPSQPVLLGRRYARTAAMEAIRRISPQHRRRLTQTSRSGEER
jgi:MerR family copper efflux transcriptional regulator